MKKSHGPAFRKQLVELDKCSACRGSALIKGVFHDLACMQCNASGWVFAATREALSLEELVTQLSLHLQAAQRQIEELKKPQATGPAAGYQENNRLGAGGTNYTGD